MVSISGQPRQWNNLSCAQGDVSTIATRCVICGSFHSTQDHWRLMAEAEMPQSPADLIDDLVKMRMYRPEAVETADAISQAELR
ncbi:MAG: nitrate ABC transporter substrate-binding protein, partial [Leptolyngbya sp. SIO3F4]|nr:nitrate ABC transporter substrate-binding protein [Leptolyngbya sp. SIO3F4]